MRSPLTVRISDGVRDQQVTRLVKGLRFTKTAPGGHHSASVSIDAPAGLLSELGPADRLFIYDGRNAHPVWDGYVDNPGRVSSAGGETYDVSAMGGVSLASDNASPVVFRSRDLDGAQWQRWQESFESAVVEVDQAVIPGVSAIKAMIPAHSVLALSDRKAAMIANNSLIATGQRAHAVTVSIRPGRNDKAIYFTTVAAVNATATTAVFVNTPMTVVGDYPISITPGGTLTPGAVVIGIQLAAGGADTDTPEDMWGAFYNFVLTPALVKADGSGATPLAMGTVRSHEVVAHVVGAMLPQIDGAGARVDVAPYAIDNLSYLEGAKPAQILDDLALWEPDYLWEILESDALGKHRFAYRAWPTTPRYEINGQDFTETGGEVDLCNRIAVSWKDTVGATQVTIRGFFVPALYGRFKDADPITLPDGQGSLANAQRIGDEVLAALNTPSRAGSAVVREPILDMLSGCVVMPWEIEPGYLVRVRDRGIDLRLTEMTYDDADCTASLTLGSPTLTLAQRIAGLAR